MSKEHLYEQILNQKATRREFLGWGGDLGKFTMAGVGFFGFFGSTFWVLGKIGERLNLGEPATVPLKTPTSLPQNQEPMEETKSAEVITYYKVVPQDTLTKISQQFNVSVERIQRANGIPNPNEIDNGQILAIPSQDWQPIPYPFELPRDYCLPWEVNSAPKSAEGIAHFYGAGEPLNRNTATGEIFNPQAITCASWIFPLESIVRVTNLANNMAVDCRVNDRGPDRLWEYGEDGLKRNVIIDLTHKAFRVIEPFTDEAFVKVELLKLPQ